MSGSTVQIRDNPEISKVIGYDKYEPDNAKKAGERMVWELQELMETNAFVDRIISQVDFNDHTGSNPAARSRSEMREYLRDNIEFYPTGFNQIAIIVYMPTYTSSIDVVNAIYDEFLVHQNESFGGTGRNLIDLISIFLDAKVAHRDLVNTELEAYLKTHPEHPFYKRREIEEAQIAIILKARDDLNKDIEKTNDILNVGYLVERSSERYFKETFVLLDAPFEPIPLNTIMEKITGVIQAAVLGVLASLLVLGLTIIFDRRITIPLDLKNVTDLPLLTMVSMETESQNQRYQFKRKKKPLLQRRWKELQQRWDSNRPKTHPAPRSKNKRLNTN
ncbi:MAG: hypothetical protein AB8G95_15085 [Anaerolineae bacterium]